MKNVQFSHLVAYLFIVSLLFFNGSCGKNDDPAPAGTSNSPNNPSNICIPGVAIFVSKEENINGKAATNERKHEFTFDSKGQIVTEKRTYLNGHLVQPGKTVVLNVTYKYDSDGFLTEKTSKIEDYKNLASPSDILSRLSEGTTKYTYTNGRLTKTADTFTIYSVDGIYQQTYTSIDNYDYDSQGRLTLLDEPGYATIRFAYNAEGLSGYSDSRYRTPIYDFVFQNNRVIRSNTKTNSASTTFDGYILYKYDAQGRLTGSETYSDTRGLTNSSEIQYDDKKRQIEITDGFPTWFPSNGPYYFAENLQFKGHPTLPSFFGVAIGNIISTKSYGYVNGVKTLGNETINTYQYGSDGYPTSQNNNVKGYNSTGAVAFQQSYNYKWSYCK